MAMKGVSGEIVQVQGGHIVRSTGRKDRHSKVYTAKGPRDRRVRLSAHTAIQFYDVQDRLGYDRPSKAVDWLIKKAKTAIDKLAELPPWHPTGNPAPEPDPHAAAGSVEMGIPSAEQSESSGYNFQLHHRQLGSENHHPDHNNHNNSSSFIPPSLGSEDAIADTMKSFFPTSSATSSMNFQTYPQDIIQRTADPTQDLGLSLHSFQDHALVHGQSQGDPDHAPPTHHPALFGSGPVGFGSGYQRMVAWTNEAGENRGFGGGFGSPPPLTQQHQQGGGLLGPQGGGGSTASFSNQRGTLQSSFSPLVRAWDDLPSMASSQRPQPIHHSSSSSSIFGTRFVSDGLPVFCIPARIHGEDNEDEHGVVSERPSSSSPPNSTHH